MRTSDRAQFHNACMSRRVEAEITRARGAQFEHAGLESLPASYFQSDLTRKKSPTSRAFYLGGITRLRGAGEKLRNELANLLFLFVREHSGPDLHRKTN